MHLDVTHHVPNDDVNAGCGLGLVCKHLISCGLLLFKLQPTRDFNQICQKKRICLSEQQASDETFKDLMS